MQCFVHIGTEKTGSTSIQSAMSDYVDLLEDQGIYLARKCGYPNNMLLPKSLIMAETGKHIPGNPGSHDSRFNPEKVLSDTQGEINEARESGFKKFLISCELFHSKFITVEQVESLKSFLATCGITDVTIIVYLRPQIDLAVSRHSTALRTGHVVSEDLPKVAANHHYFDYHSMLNRWASVFGRTHVLPKIFDKENLYDGCAFKDFLSVISTCLAKEITYESTPQNTELNLNEQHILLGVNKTLKELNVDEDKERVLRRNIIAALDKVSPNYSSPATYLPTEAEARDFQNVFDNANSQIARNWFGREVLFDMDFSKYRKKRSTPAQQDLFSQFQDAVLPLLVDQLNQIEFIQERHNRLRKRHARQRRLIPDSAFE